MTDPQLDLDIVKQQFQDAERKLTALASEIESVTATRQSLDSTAQALAAASTEFGDSAKSLQSLTDTVKRAAQAIEDADPAELRNRIDDVEQAIGSNANQLAIVAKNQKMFRWLLLAVLVVAILTSVLVVVNP